MGSSDLDVALTKQQLHELCKLTEGCTGCELQQICRDAAMGPIRAALAGLPLTGNGSLCVTGKDCGPDDVVIQPVTMQDFMAAVSKLRPTTSIADVTMTEE